MTPEPPSADPRSPSSPRSWLRSAVAWWVLGVAGAAAVVVALVTWTSGMPRPQAIAVTALVAALAEVLGAWFEERAQARRTGSVPAGIAKLIGANGRAATTCAPLGTVRVGLELWDARALTPEPIEPGEPVIVRAAEGRRLLVERE